MSLAYAFLGGAIVAFFLSAPELAVVLGLAVLVALYASAPSDPELDARFRNAR